MNDAIVLPLPTTWTSTEKRKFLSLCRSIARGIEPKTFQIEPITLKASVLVVNDLYRQGWTIEIKPSHVQVTPPESSRDPNLERSRVRRQEEVKRDEQLRRPSVAQFISAMESPREFKGRFVSIFNLMRDGTELGEKLARVESQDLRHEYLLEGVIDPYVQIVESGERCVFTGLLLNDIWRYFRHTWTNQLTSTPGRSMMIIIRDRAADDHPVIGIASLGSSVIQMRERDQWIGWQREQVVDAFENSPTVGIARWIWSRLEEQRSEMYLNDLIADGLYWPALWKSPTEDAIAKLRLESIRCRNEHNRFVDRSDFQNRFDAEDASKLLLRTESALFRSKRCKALSELLEVRLALLPFFANGATKSALRLALDDPRGREAIASVGRRAKSDSVGTEIADLNVCGAIAPYNEILGGKLVAMLAVSPTVIRAYHSRYSEYASLIASSCAGRPIRRRNRLVFIGTTSLYGSQTSQYNRLSLPAKVFGGNAPIEFRRLGKSQSYGTSHMSDRTVMALTELTEQSNKGSRVNSIFGEGVSPKFRKIRQGLDLLGWPSDSLLQHGRPRIIYGVTLVDNLLPYLLGIDLRPRYLFRTAVKGDSKVIFDWWVERWLRDRLGTSDRIERVMRHKPGMARKHGARVSLPSDSDHTDSYF